MTEDRVAFVAGATGYTGQALVASLLSRDFRVLAHIRPDSSRREYWEGYFQDLGAIPVDFAWDREALVEGFRREKPNYIYALVGTTRARAKEIARKGGEGSQESYLKIDYGLTALLIDAAKERPSLSRFVYLSAMGASAGARGAYMEARWLAEEALRNSGLPYTIARPAFISGSDRDEARTLERFGALTTDFILGMGAKMGLGSWSEGYRSITATSLADSLAELGLDERWENKVALRKDLR